MSAITIVGLGPGDENMLPEANMQTLQQANQLFLRTTRHPLVPQLQQQGLSFISFDNYYEQGDNFEQVYHMIQHRVLEAASQGRVVYAVPGHPLVAETSVQLILQAAKQKNIPTQIVPAMSFLDAIYAALNVDPAQGMQILDGLQLQNRPVNPDLALIITQIYSGLVAADIKLDLLEIYPPEHEAVLIRAAGVTDQQQIEKMPLYQLDHCPWIDHLTSLYLPPLPTVRKQRAQYPLDELVHVMAQLRGPDGCPWDKEQDHQSITPYLVEETYEVIEAINLRDMYKICEELGDLLLQIVFHAQIAQEKGAFDINDVVTGISQKMIRRHPHVFGTRQVQNSHQVLVNWEDIKKAERKLNREPERKSVLDGVPQGLPALPRAFKIQKKAARVGFDWPDYQGALDKLREEYQELKNALRQEVKGDIKQELGDVLFAAVNVARLTDIDPESALTATINKFIRRFHHIEQSAQQQGVDLQEMTLEQMDYFWEQAKKLQKA